MSRQRLRSARRSPLRRSSCARRSELTPEIHSITWKKCPSSSPESTIRGAGNPPRAFNANRSRRSIASSKGGCEPMDRRESKAIILSTPSCEPLRTWWTSAPRNICSGESTLHSPIVSPRLRHGLSNFESSSPSARRKPLAKSRSISGNAVSNVASGDSPRARA